MNFDHLHSTVTTKIKPKMFNRQPDPTLPVCHFFYSVFSGSGRVAVFCPPLEILFKIFLHCTKSGTIDLDILTMRCSNLSWNFVIIIYLIKCFLIFVLPVDWGKLIDFPLLLLLPLIINYEAWTPLRLGVSRSPIRVGVWHFYDTRTTRVGQLRMVS